MNLYNLCSRKLQVAENKQTKEQQQKNPKKQKTSLTSDKYSPTVVWVPCAPSVLLAVV